MMVPVPMKQLPEECFDEPPAASAPALPEHKPVVAEAVAMAPTPAKPARKGWSTGAKVAGVAAVGGLAVGGVLLGTEIAEHGAEATFDAIGDSVSTGAEAAGDALGVAGEHVAEFAGDAGEHMAEFAGDAGDWFVDAADTTGDFIMDLF